MPIYDFPEVEPPVKPDKEPGVGKAVIVVVVIGSICVIIGAAAVAWLWWTSILELGAICLNMI